MTTSYNAFTAPRQLSMVQEQKNRNKRPTPTFQQQIVILKTTETERIESFLRFSRKR